MITPAQIAEHIKQQIIRDNCHGDENLFNEKAEMLKYFLLNNEPTELNVKKAMILAA